MINTDGILTDQSLNECTEHMGGEKNHIKPESRSKFQKNIWINTVSGHGILNNIVKKNL